MPLLDLLQLPATARNRWWLLTVVGAAAVLRLGAALWSQADGDSAFLTDDSLGYLQPAEALRTEHAYDMAPGSGTPEFFRPPGYPAFIAAVYTVAPDSYLSIALVQAAISTATVFLTFTLGSRLGNETAGLVGAGILAVDLSAIDLSRLVLTDSIAAFLVAAFGLAVIAIVCEAQHRLRWAATAGALVALATLVRPTFFYFPVVVLVLVAAGRGGIAQRAKVAVALIVPVVLIVGGWGLRNSAEAGSWRVSGTESYNMYFLIAGGVEAELSGRSAADVRDDWLAAAEDEFAGWREGDKYDVLQQRGIDFAVDHPKQLAKILALGLYNQLFSVRDLFEAFGMSSGSAPAFAARAVLGAGYALAAIGIIWVWRRNRDLRRAHAMIIALLAYLYVASSGPWAGARFRVPPGPLMSLYIGFGVVAVAAWWSSGSLRRNAGTSETTDTTA